jgi:hypothetical protein
MEPGDIRTQAGWYQNINAGPHPREIRRPSGRATSGPHPGSTAPLGPPDRAERPPIASRATAASGGAIDAGRERSAIVLALAAPRSETMRRKPSSLMGTKRFPQIAGWRFAHLKTQHGFERVRLRGLAGARDEFHLATIVQHLKTTALRLLGPPTGQVCASIA